jgi:hypothetical protein
VFPIFTTDLFYFGRCYQSSNSIILHHEKAAARGRQQVVLNKFLQRYAAVHSSAIAKHQVRYAAVAKLSQQFHLYLTALGRIQQEPANEGNPQSAKVCSEKEAKQAEQNEEYRDGLSHSRSKPRNRTLEVGGESRAEVRLKNVGDTPIDIPWSTDSGVIKEAPNPDVLQWEQANLVVLLDKKNKTIALKTADWPLYGSRFVGGSQLTIKPGEWVTAFIEFKVEDLYHIVSFTEFPVGEARLSLEWEQASRAWGREKCGWSRAWFDYGGDYYKQERPTIAVQINRSGSGAGENTK